TRIQELRGLKQKEYDLSKLLRLCEELNITYSYQCYYSVAFLTRALMDHVAPIFKCKNFDEVANNYKADKSEASFKRQMLHLNNSLRNISDRCIHSQIRRSESLPNQTQIDFKNDVDVLLSEIVWV
ncbi:MAG: hypothetical protein M3N42_13720, partial [Cyanobacteriota bacterium]|nr:hypothetical protein [Cyanobacteriota bacterium]